MSFANFQVEMTYMFIVHMCVADLLLAHFGAGSWRKFDEHRRAGCLHHWKWEQCEAV